MINDYKNNKKISELILAILDAGSAERIDRIALDRMLKAVAVIAFKEGQNNARNNKKSVNVSAGSEEIEFGIERIKEGYNKLQILLGSDLRIK